MKKLLLIALVFTGFSMLAQDPVVTARFANPRYDCSTQSYCVDVQFKSDVPNQRIFGINVRFFYDNQFLEFSSVGNFITGYGTSGFPAPTEGIPGSGIPFGMTGNPEYVNGNVSLLDPLQIYYLESDYKTLFSLCFQVVDPNSFNIQDFCPSLIWDLELNPADGGFEPGNDGLVITLVDPGVGGNSIPSTENVIQYNWAYYQDVPLFGYHVAGICIPTICWTVPVSDWAIFLGIALMLVTTVFIYRRRFNS